MKWNVATAGATAGPGAKTYPTPSASTSVLSGVPNDAVDPDPVHQCRAEGQTVTAGARTRDVNREGLGSLGTHEARMLDSKPIGTPYLRPAQRPHAQEPADPGHENQHHADTPHVPDAPHALVELLFVRQLEPCIVFGRTHVGLTE